MPEELTIDVVRAWLAQNKDAEPVVAFLKELSGGAEPKLTAETVTEFLKGDEGLKLLQPMLDRRANEAVRTHDQKTKDAAETEVKRRVAEEILKINPQETPEQKQIRELRERIDKSEKDAARSALRRAIVEESAKEGVPSWWVDNLADVTIEEARLFIKRKKKEDEDLTTKVKNELLASSAFKPGSGNGQSKTKIDLSKMTPQQIMALEMEGKLDAALTGQPVST